MSSTHTQRDRGEAWSVTYFMFISVVTKFSQPLTLESNVCVCVCIPVFEVRRRQLSPWHRVLTGTVGHEPSTRWTVSPDTPLIPASVLMEMIQSGALVKVGNAE